MFLLCGNLILARVASIFSRDMYDQHSDRDELFQNLSSAVEEVSFLTKFTLKFPCFVTRPANEIDFP